MSSDLQGLLRDLITGPKQPTASDALIAHPVNDGSTHYIAITTDLAPILLLSSVDAAERIVPPLRLRGIEIAYGVHCRLVLPDGSLREKVLTTIKCTTADSQEQSFFVDSCATLLRIVGNEPRTQVVISATQHLANVFQRIARPARESVTGIMGELLLIDLSPNPGVTIRAWRQRPEDRFDFSLENIRLEVKSSGNRSRIHHLTYEQCSPPDGTVGLLASVLVESAGGGQSLAELIESISERVRTELDAVFRLYEVVADTLGDSLVESLGERFDRNLAEDSFTLFDLRSIPAIRDSLPRGIGHVKFQSDVSLANPVTATDYVVSNPRIRDLLRT